MSRPKLAAGGVPDTNTLVTESKEKQKKQALTASEGISLLFGSPFLLCLSHPGFSDTGESAAHCSWWPTQSLA